MTKEYTLINIENHANFDKHILLYSNVTGEILCNIQEKRSWLSKAEKSYSVSHGRVLIIDDWFSLFEIDDITYALFVSNTINVYKVIVDESPTMKLINRFIISPCCHVKMALDLTTFALSLNDHYLNTANNLVYAISLEQLIRPSDLQQVQLQNLPHYYAKYIFESHNSQAEYVGNGITKISKFWGCLSQCKLI